MKAHDRTEGGPGDMKVPRGLPGESPPYTVCECGSQLQTHTLGPKSHRHQLLAHPVQAPMIRSLTITGQGESSKLWIRTALGLIKWPT